VHREVRGALDRLVGAAHGGGTHPLLGRALVRVGLGDEEVVLVTEGELVVTINGITTRATAGSIIFISSGDEHGWRNAGDKAATYYVMRVKTDATPATVAMN